ncbi:MAG: hypothetical protein HY332_00280 [Chloroflexi bacterium]|nr:hypothetical protein [Chloroflexota bacterium]
MPREPLRPLGASDAHAAPGEPAPATPARRAGPAGSDELEAAQPGDGLPEQIAAGVDERTRLAVIRDELSRLEPFGPVTDEALAALRERYWQRWEALAAAAAAASTRSIASARAGLAAAPRAAPRPSEPAPALAAAPGGAFSLQEFLADRSILIVSYVGAFLLIVATLLFEVYGADTFGGLVRFAAVLALDLVFGAAAWVCLKTPKLRLVGTTYLAIFALMVPLVFVAAYVFLVLRQYGISVELAVTVAGACCALLYGALAAKLDSVGYATLSLAAVAVGWLGALNVLGLDVWRGAGLAPLMLLYVLAAHRPAWLRRSGSSPAAPAAPFAKVFTSPAEYFVHGTALFALAWTFLGVPAELRDSTALSLRSEAPRWIVQWRPTALLAGLTLGYSVYLWRSERRRLTVLVAFLLTLAVVSAGEALEWSETVGSLALLFLAWLYALAARRLPPAALPSAVRGLAAVQAAICLVLTTQPDWLQASIFLAVAALGILLAVDTSYPAWLLFTGVASSLAWYWLVKLVVPPPPRPTFAGLLTAYTPLPVVHAIAALVTGRFAGQRWTVPLYGAAAVNATWIVAGLFFQDKSDMLGWALLVYAFAVYVAAAVEHFPIGVVVATFAAGGGLVALFDAAATPPAYVPPALAAATWVVYVGGVAWEWWQRRGARGESPRVLEAAATDAGDRRSEDGRGVVPGVPEVVREPVQALEREWVRVHRPAALIGAALTAVLCVAVPEFLEAGNPGALAALAALLSLALMLFVDGHRYGLPALEYAAGGALAAGTFWIARYTGAANPQWYVAVPGLWLVWAGVQLPHDSRIDAGPDTHRLLVAAGAALLLGTSAYQSFAERGAYALYAAVVVLEGVAAVLGGIALRQRVLVVFGAGAVAVGALRALLLLLQQIPLYAVFGVVALLLLAGAAILAMFRDRFGGTRRVIGSWSDWY